MASARPIRRKPGAAAPDLAEIVATTFDGYARRGVFRGFSRGPVVRGKPTFRVVWHREKVFEFVLDAKAPSIRLVEVLANVPPGSTMQRELQAFVKSRHADDLPEHRRVDTRKAQITAHNRAGSMSLTVKFKARDCQYAAQKLVHLVHEIFLSFLVDGNYFEYMVETFDLDPDSMS